MCSHVFSTVYNKRFLCGRFEAKKLQCRIHRAMDTGWTTRDHKSESNREGGGDFALLHRFHTDSGIHPALLRKQREIAVEHSTCLPIQPRVKNGWGCAWTLPYVFTALCLLLLILVLTNKLRIWPVWNPIIRAISGFYTTQDFSEFPPVMSKPAKRPAIRIYAYSLPNNTPEFG
jgi:hypothetical protein